MKRTRNGVIFIRFYNRVGRMDPGLRRGDDFYSNAAEMDRTKDPAHVIEKVIGGNFDRLFREVWVG